MVDSNLAYGTPTSKYVSRVLSPLSGALGWG
jgi:hypothetical protein